MNVIKDIDTSLNTLTCQLQNELENVRHLNKSLQNGLLTSLEDNNTNNQIQMLTSELNKIIRYKLLLEQQYEIKCKEVQQLKGKDKNRLQQMQSLQKHFDILTNRIHTNLWSPLNKLLNDKSNNFEKLLKTSKNKVLTDIINILIQIKDENNDFKHLEDAQRNSQKLIKQIRDELICEHVSESSSFAELQYKSQSLFIPNSKPIERESSILTNDTLMELQNDNVEMVNDINDILQSVEIGKAKRDTFETVYVRELEGKLSTMQKNFENLKERLSIEETNYMNKDKIMSDLQLQLRLLKVSNGKENESETMGKLAEKYGNKCEELAAANDKLKALQHEYDQLLESKNNVKNIEPIKKDPLMFRHPTLPKVDRKSIFEKEKKYLLSTIQDLKRKINKNDKRKSDMQQKCSEMVGNNETLKFVNQCQKNTITRIMNNFRYMNMENKIEIQQQLNEFNRYICDITIKLQQQMKALNKENNYLQNKRKKICNDLNQMRINNKQHIKTSKKDNLDIKIILNEFSDFMIDSKNLICNELTKNDTQNEINQRYIKNLEENNIQLQRKVKELNALHDKNDATSAQLRNQIMQYENKNKHFMELYEKENKYSQSLEDKLNETVNKNQEIIKKLLIESEREKNENIILMQQHKILNQENDQFMNEMELLRIELTNIQTKNICFSKNAIESGEQCDELSHDFGILRNLIQKDLNGFSSFLIDAQKQISNKCKGKLILFAGEIIGSSKNKNEILTKFKWKLLDKETEIKTLEAKNKILEHKNKRLNDKLLKLKEKTAGLGKLLKLMPKYLYEVVTKMKQEINLCKKEAQMSAKEMHFFTEKIQIKLSAVNSVKREETITKSDSENTDKFNTWVKSVQNELQRLGGISDDLQDENADLQQLTESMLSNKNKYKSVILHFYHCLVNLENITIQIKHEFDEYNLELNDYSDILHSKLQYALNDDEIMLPVSFIDELVTKMDENGLLLKKMDAAQIKLIQNLTKYTQQIVSTQIKIEVQKDVEKETVSEIETISEIQFSSENANVLHEQISNLINMNPPQIIRIVRAIKNDFNVLEASDLDLPLKNNTDGNTILHKTADLGSVVLLEILLSLKCIRINTQNNNGDTVMHIVCNNLSKHIKYMQMFRMFVTSKWSQDIRYDIKNNQNKIALQLVATEENKQQILKILEKNKSSK